MDIKGRLTAKLAEQRGTSKAGKDWVKQDIILETIDKYPKSVCISLMGEDKIKLIQNLKEGELITCSINIESREYNSRWFTSVSAWKIEVNEKPQTSADPMPVAESSTIFYASGGEDGLPF